ncbi:MAG: hypothetical protein DYH08_01710 [Actinobacteria bacterium ATB1]|nr:hypothetical protein [Actinobacteria bacterium ATB1]
MVVGLLAVCLALPFAGHAAEASPTNCSASRRLGLCGRTSRPARPCKEKCRPCTTEACRERARARHASSGSLRDVVDLPDPTIAGLTPGRGVAGAETRLLLDVPQVRNPYLEIDGSAAALYVHVVGIEVNTVSRPGEAGFDSDFAQADPSAWGGGPRRVQESGFRAEIGIFPGARGLVPLTCRVVWQVDYSTSDGRTAERFPALTTTSATVDYPVVAARGVLAPPS